MSLFNRIKNEGTCTEQSLPQVSYVENNELIHGHTNQTQLHSEANEFDRTYPDYRAFAPRPLTVDGTDLPQSLLEDLMARTLFETGTTDIEFLATSLGLSAPILEQLISVFRNDARVEVLGPQGTSKALRYALTEQGKKFAYDAFERSGYLGPAPITIDQYENILKYQTVRNHQITHASVSDAFSDMTINPVLINQLGAAMHSSKATFIYGTAGTGKTYVCNRLSRLLGDPILVPYAIVAGSTIVKIHDSAIHKSAQNPHADNTLLLGDTFDQRFALCERPFVCSGGELTAELLEVQYDSASKQYQAPLQLKASNGIYLIDDLGRQRISPTELFNRWIVPMETGEDYLNLQSGDRMVVPFDLTLIFSTNLNPNELADAAFLRRIGHKIKFEVLDEQSYSAIWAQVCANHHIHFDPQIVDYAIQHLHLPNDIDLLPCHPRDLISAALNYLDFMQLPRQLDIASLQTAWETTFVKDNPIQEHSYA